MIALIIDDDPSIMELLASFLTQNGHQVLKAQTAQEGLRLFTLEQPDVIFLDIMMPDKNGIDSLKDIKSIDKNMPVVIITGFKDAEMVISAFREGAFDCLLKPFNYDYLKNEILTRIPLRKR